MRPNPLNLVLLRLFFGPPLAPAVAAGVYVTPDAEESILADPGLAGLFGGVDSEADLRRVLQIDAGRGVDVIKTRGTERAGRPDTDPRQDTQQIIEGGLQ